jgi:tetratricopeptide (TPR) repeat protein
VKRRTLLAAAFVLLLAGAAFRSVPGLPFVTYDDPAYVLENPGVRQGLGWSGIRWGWRAVAEGNWHPLTWWSHQADVSLFGLDPAGHHAVNLALHLANALLLFLLLRALTGQPGASGLAAALFGAHPLQAESVAWVAQRKTLLAGFLRMLALAAHLRSVRRPGLPGRLLVAGLFALGLMAKPVVVTLPLALLLLDFWPLGRLRTATFRALAAEKWPLLLLAAAGAAATLATQARAIVTTANLPAADRLAGAVAAWGWYLGTALWPTHLAVFHPHPGSRLPPLQLIGSALAVAALTLLAARTVRSRPQLAVGWGWYLLTLLPVLGVVQVGGQLVADRYAYLPLAGLGIALAWTLRDAALATPRAAPVIGGAAVAALLALAVATGRQVATWTSSERLFTHALEATGENWLARAMLGAIRAQEGRLAEAADSFERSVRANPRSPETWYNLGLVRQREGRWDAALEAYGRALALRPGMVEALTNRGLAYERLGRRDEARASYEAALREAPDHFEALANLGALELESGRFAEAREAWELAARLRPADAAIRSQLEAAIRAAGGGADRGFPGVPPRR